MVRFNARAHLTRARGIADDFFQGLHMTSLRLRFFLLLSLVPAGEIQRLAAQEAVSQKPEVLESQAPGKKQPERPASVSPFLAGPTPKWIWGAHPDKKYQLNKKFVAPKDGKARLKFSCDNEVEVALNGNRLGRSTEWEVPVEVDASKALREGDNTLSAVVTNHGGIAAFVCKLIVTAPGGQETQIISDESWSANEFGVRGAIAPVKIIGKLGDGPWGDLFAQASGPAGNAIFQLPEGFQIERLFTVPRETMGSWVCLGLDDRGRLIASDQDNRGLFRITPGKVGTQESTRIEKLKVNMSGVQGMLHAFGSLYVCANGGPGSGLYRLTDTHGDDQYDKVEKLKSIRGGGEHGPHALRLSPDGKGILLLCGNHTLPPEGFQASRIPSNWAEDHLLPRQWDANGHAVGIMAPGGYVARTDPEGKTWEMLSIGYRNPYDMAVHPDGEMFVYDADMEWDLGMPWYRPTRVNHATSGSELGWRSGTGKWPAYYPDSLPAMIDIGPGSPVGVELGAGAKFPAKYQNALYICDWTFGTIYALHLQPSGSTYKAKREEFVSRSALPLTDLVVGKDGALYFIVGGRGTQSELYRVSYTGNESTEPVDLRHEAGQAERAERQKLESFHRPGPVAEADLSRILLQLNHSDRFTRYAARIALEHRSPASWEQKVLERKEPDALIAGIIALAHQGNKQLKRRGLEALGRIDFNSLTQSQKLDWLRAMQLLFLRMGEPDKDEAASWAKRLEPLFPAHDDFVDRELMNLLVYLKSTKVAAIAMRMLQKPSKPIDPVAIDEVMARNRGYGGTVMQMMANAPDPQKIQILFTLRNLKEPWTREERKIYFTALSEARTRTAGASYQGFLNNIEREAFDNATDDDRLAIEALGLRKPPKLAALPKPIGPGKSWTMDELSALSKAALKGRSFEGGKRAFAAARCIVCHRYWGDGGATGPDLSQAGGRFNFRDLCESIVEPNKIVSDQYKASIIETKKGKLITGKIVSQTAERLIVVTDPEDSTKTLELLKSDIEELKPSPISLMPGKLLDSLNQTEVLDLIAYLLARGDSGNAMFRP